MKRLNTMDRCKRLNTAKAERGFTLIEVMIVVAVLAIIAAIAIPQYQGYVTRAKRAEAKRTLLEAAQFLERNYTAAGCYSYSSTAGCLSQSGTVLTLPPPLLRAPNEGKASYEIPAPVFTNSGQVFSLVAIPCGSGGTCDAGSDPFVDATCDRFTLTNTGLRGLSGTYTGTLASCWQR